MNMETKIDRLIDTIEQISKKQTTDSIILARMDEKFITLNDRGCSTGNHLVRELEIKHDKEMSNINKRIDKQRNLAGVAAGLGAAIAGWIGYK